MNTTSSPKLTLLPAGFVALAVNGDQITTEVRNRYLEDGVVASIPASDHGSRPWLPLELAPWRQSWPRRPKAGPLEINPACGKCDACRRDFPCTDLP